MVGKKRKGKGSSSSQAQAVEFPEGFIFGMGIVGLDGGPECKAVASFFISASFCMSSGLLSV